jgi:hypothetical protein
MNSASILPPDMHSRIVRLIEAIEDGDADLALGLACGLERELVAMSERRAA